MRKKAFEVIEAVEVFEAAEVIEAAEVSKARKIISEVFTIMKYQVEFWHLFC